MENWHGSSRRSVASMRDDEDFEEDEDGVWTSSSSLSSRVKEIGGSRGSQDSSRRIKKNPSSERQFSAPMSIPEWSNANHVKSSYVYDGHDHDGDGGNDDHHDDYGEMVPPHEWIARKLGRSKISSFSMYEGVGRTLKGRDLKRVRNAVLRKTGFLE